MTLTVDDYLSLIGAAARRLAADAVEAGLDAPVPTCPEWTVAQLVGHQGEVHRWATAVIAGALTDPDLPESAVAATLPPDDEAVLLSWFTAGAQALIDALGDAPDDLTAAVFLRDAPRPRVFWARRQTHETTIHAVDALSARLGRMPTAAEVGIDAAVAADGIDELLTGFITRRSSRLRVDGDQAAQILVAPGDVDLAWTVTVSAEPPVTVRGADPDSGREPDCVLTGTAAALYLGLWNRGDEIAATGADELLGLWRERVRVRWS
jgi:uncharacterized protein (TIGR03083 family)